MQLYVIGVSPEGPCKIGVAANPKKRLKELQTGNQEVLSLYHVEPLGIRAKSVERVIHRLLSEHRTSAQNEWFGVHSDHACKTISQAIGGLATNSLSRDVPLDEAQRRLTLEWLKERNRFEEGGEDEEFKIPHPDLMRLFALTLNSPANIRINFNDFLETYNDGMWFRWAFEKMCRSLPKGKGLEPYLEAERYLRKQGVAYGKGLSERWIEWSMARDLASDEIFALSEIWDKYVIAHERIYEAGAYAIDRVDEVQVFALLGDRERGDRDKIVFLHPEFRAVLVPKKRISLVAAKSKKYWASLRLQQLEDCPSTGFIAPPIRSHIWQMPLRAWCDDARERQEKSFASFLRQPNKRYSGAHQSDADLSSVGTGWCSLDVIDEFGEF